MNNHGFQQRPGLAGHQILRTGRDKTVEGEKTEEEEKKHQHGS